MKRVLLLLILSATTFASDDAWLQEVLKRENREASSWLQDELHRLTIQQNYPVCKQEASQKLLKDALAKKEKCFTGELSQIDDPKFLVFVSFSMPESTWKSLSIETERAGGVFVLKGLPNNSFVELSKKLKKLREDGVNVNVQINPQLFGKYQIEHVPTFVAINGEKFDKVSGNISLGAALQKIADTGETKQ